MPASSHAKVRDLLYLEADLLDRRRWAEWLGLYTADCVFWVPSWASEDELTSEPELEVNMIYLKGKPSLEARIHRLDSGHAYAQVPLARTTHLVDTIRVTAADGNDIEVSAKWLTLSVDARWGKQMRCGWYEYRLSRKAGELAIA